MSKQVIYNDNDRAIVNALRDGDLTLAQINEGREVALKPGNITSALHKGLISKSGMADIVRPSIRKVGTYAFSTADVQSRENGKAYDYSDGEKAILAAASGVEGYFTLAQLAKVMNLDKLASGSVNSLVKKGNLVKGDQVEVEGTAKAKVGIYHFEKDIPSAE